MTFFDWMTNGHTGAVDFISGSRPAVDALRALEKQLFLVKSKAMGARHRLFLEERRRAMEWSHLRDTVAAKQRELEVLQRENGALERVQGGQQRTLDHLTGRNRDGGGSHTSK